MLTDIANNVLLLTALPVCLAQFTIQGASDGNRVSQGLKYSEEKGIEYTDQSESLGAGDFTIQGATDGNSNFRIQGATDGHSNFQIQGPSQGAISTFNVQPPTDGHSQSVIRGPYDANQAAQSKSLQYNDPSGLRVNWKSYGHDRQPRLRQPQAEPHYAEQTALASPQRSAPPPPPPPQHHAPVHPPINQPSYRPYNDAPAQIKQLLQFQAQIPYVNAIPEQFRYDHLAAAQAQAQQVQSSYQQEQSPRPEYRGSKPRGPPRHRRQAPQQHPHARQQQQQQQQPQYQRLSQPPVEPTPQYSTNLPNNLQALLKYQAQIPYNIIANQIRYVPDKPYVPQPIQHQQQQQQPSAPPQAAEYQGQGDAYQGQASTYTQAHLNPYQGYPQEQSGYNQGQGVRPVTENQY
ncbi:PREDICTED: chromatin modification-related protein eaf-1-like [Polistes canadensis]|uniref:chromatin modification-related protein eaf-1-like n=1 Tax=Polistes canadensis TaxID=91411 RepID=UPI000718BF6D|nr:PREDICTED: chromatin modification-related protein eaf-1-like [Polistes canadensis]